MARKIIPCLWFNDNAKKAVSFYTSIFSKSKINSTLKYDSTSSKIANRPKGSVMTIDFMLEGQPFLALNGGPHFRHTPAISFFVSCKTEKEITTIWKKLSKNGTVMMELQEYPFSKKFGWVQDQYGISWQLNLGSAKQKITPFFMFIGKQHGKAKQAIKFYTKTFHNTKIEFMQLWGAKESEPKGTVKHAAFSLDGNTFRVMESAYNHKFGFSQAISFIINCKTQKEIDYFWTKLSKGGQEQPCGWVIDKYGIAWQVTPYDWDKMLLQSTPAQSKRYWEAMAQMKKIDMKKLKQAGNS